MAGKIFVLTGPSGVGKTTVAKSLLEKISTLKKVLTSTTRPIRDYETNGVDYRFFNNEEFKKMIENDEMFEWARVYDRFYGSRKVDVQELRDQKFDVLFVIDVQGAKTIQDNNPDATIIFLKAESPEILLERLERRDHGKTVNMDERKEALKAEMAYCDVCNYSVVNKENRLDDAVQEMVDIIEKEA